LFEMLGVYYYGVNDLRVEEAPDPKIKNETDVLVKVNTCGVCGSDIKTLHGEYGGNPPVILGHEISGEVAAIGSLVKNVKAGDRIVVDPNLTCGTCYYCRRGLENLCENVITVGLHSNGGLANSCVVPSNAVYRIPDSLPSGEAALSEPLACVINGFNRCQVRAGDYVGIVGLGPIGFLFFQLLNQSAASKVIAFEVKPDRAEAGRRMGVKHIIDPTTPDWKRELLGMTDGRGVDVAIEAVGSPAAAKVALESVRRGGRVNMFGINKPNVNLEVEAFRLTRYQLEVVGSFIDQFTFPAAIQMLADKKIDAKAIITHSIALKDAKTAFDLMEQGKGIKIHVKP
jgi:L-iditol 2-dehydrogenase